MEKCATSRGARLPGRGAAVPSAGISKRKCPRARTVQSVMCSCVIDVNNVGQRITRKSRVHMPRVRVQRPFTSFGLPCDPLHWERTGLRSWGTCSPGCGGHHASFVTHSGNCSWWPVKYPEWIFLSWDWTLSTTAAKKRSQDTAAWI